MRPDIDIESLFKNIRRKDIDPTRVEACQERLLKHFAKLDAEVEASTRKPIKKYFVYATVCALIIGIVISSVFFYKAQVTIATEKTRTIMINKYHRINISTISIDLLSRKSIVDIPYKRLVVDLNTGSVDQVINPNQIELTDDEKKIAQNVLKKDKFSYFVSESKIIDEVTNGYGISSFCFGSMVNDDGEIVGGEEGGFIKIETLSSEDDGVFGITILSFYPVDPIIQIIGYQYPGSETKFARIEVQPNESIGLRTFFCIDLDRKEIVGPYVEKDVPYIEKKDR